MARNVFLNWLAPVLAACTGTMYGQTIGLSASYGLTGPPTRADVVFRGAQPSIREITYIQRFASVAIIQTEGRALADALAISEVVSAIAENDGDKTALGVVASPNTVFAFLPNSDIYTAEPEAPISSVAPGSGEALTDEPMGFGADILKKAYCLLLLAIISWTITHKVDALGQFVEKVLSNVNSWRSVVVFALTLLFLYLLLRMLEDGVLRSIGLALIMTALFAGGLSSCVGLMSRIRHSRRPVFCWEV